MPTNISYSIEFSKNNRNTYSQFEACLNGIAVGNLAGWPQAAIPQLLSSKQYNPTFDDSEAAWIAGIFFPGMLLGGFVSLYVAAIFGKRKLFLLACLPLATGWSIIAVSATFWVSIISDRCYIPWFCSTLSTTKEAIRLCLRSKVSRVIEKSHTFFFFHVAIYFWPDNSWPWRWYDVQSDGDVSVGNLTNSSAK